jgi:hypothetical protein
MKLVDQYFRKLAGRGLCSSKSVHMRDALQLGLSAAKMHYRHTWHRATASKIKAEGSSWWTLPPRIASK